MKSKSRIILRGRGEDDHDFVLYFLVGLHMHTAAVTLHSSTLLLKWLSSRLTGQKKIDFSPVFSYWASLSFIIPRQLIQMFCYRCKKTATLSFFMLTFGADQPEASLYIIV